MSNKVFAERLNNELDHIGIPALISQRVEDLAKLLKIPRFKAESLLEGSISENDPVVLALATELDVDVDWLIGKINDA